MGVRPVWSSLVWCLSLFSTKCLFLPEMKDRKESGELLVKELNLLWSKLCWRIMFSKWKRIPKWGDIFQRILNNEELNEWFYLRFASYRLFVIWFPSWLEESGSSVSGSPQSNAFQMMVMQCQWCLVSKLSVALLSINWGMMETVAVFDPAKKAF